MSPKPAVSPPALRTRSRMKQAAFDSLEPVSPGSPDGSSMDSDDYEEEPTEATLRTITTENGPGAMRQLPAMRQSLELASRAALLLLVLLWSAAFAPTAVKFAFDSTRGGHGGYSQSTGHLEAPFGLDDLVRELDEVLSFPEGLPVAEFPNTRPQESSGNSGGTGCPEEAPPQSPCPEEQHCDTSLLERCQEELGALQEGMQRLRESSDALSGEKEAQVRQVQQHLAVVESRAKELDEQLLTSQGHAERLQDDYGTAASELQVCLLKASSTREELDLLRESFVELEGRVSPLKEAEEHLWAAASRTSELLGRGKQEALLLGAAFAATIASEASELPAAALQLLSAAAQGTKGLLPRVPSTGLLVFLERTSWWPSGWAHLPWEKALGPLRLHSRRPGSPPSASSAWLREASKGSSSSSSSDLLGSLRELILKHGTPIPESWGSALVLSCLFAAAAASVAVPVAIVVRLVWPRGNVRSPEIDEDVQEAAEDVQEAAKDAQESARDVPQGSLEDQQQQQQQHTASKASSASSVGVEIDCGHPKAARAASVDAAVAPEEAEPGHQREEQSHEALGSGALTEAAVEHLQGEVGQEQRAEGEEAASAAKDSNSKDLSRIRLLNTRCRELEDEVQNLRSRIAEGEDRPVWEQAREESCKLQVFTPPARGSVSAPPTTAPAASRLGGSVMAEAVGEEHGRLQMRRLWEENERLRASQRAASLANSQLRLELGLLQAAGEVDGSRVEDGDEEEAEGEEQQQEEEPKEGSTEEAEGEGLERLTGVTPRRLDEEEGLEKLVSQHQERCAELETRNGEMAEHLDSLLARNRDLEAAVAEKAQAAQDLSDAVADLEEKLTSAKEVAARVDSAEASRAAAMAETRRLQDSVAELEAALQAATSAQAGAEEAAAEEAKEHAAELEQKAAALALVEEDAASLRQKLDSLREEKEALLEREETNSRELLERMSERDRMDRELAVLHSRNEALQRDLGASVSRNLELEQIHLPSPMPSRTPSQSHIAAMRGGGPGEAEMLRARVRELEQQIQELIEEKEEEENFMYLQNERLRADSRKLDEVKLRVRELEECMEDLGELVVGPITEMWKSVVAVAETGDPEADEDAVEWPMADSSSEEGSREEDDGDEESEEDDEGGNGSGGNSEYDAEEALCAREEREAELRRRIEEVTRERDEAAEEAALMKARLEDWQRSTQATGAKVLVETRQSPAGAREVLLKQRTDLVHSLQGEVAALERQNLHLAEQNQRCLKETKGANDQLRHLHAEFVHLRTDNDKLRKVLTTAGFSPAPLKALQPSSAVNTPPAAPAAFAASHSPAGASMAAGGAGGGGGVLSFEAAESEAPSPLNQEQHPLMPEAVEAALSPDAVGLRSAADALSSHVRGLEELTAEALLHEQGLEAASSWAAQESAGTEASCSFASSSYENQEDIQRVSLVAPTVMSLSQRHEELGEGLRAHVSLTQHLSDRIAARGPREAPSVEPSAPASSSGGGAPETDEQLHQREGGEEAPPMTDEAAAPGRGDDDDSVDKDVDFEDASVGSFRVFSTPPAILRGGSEEDQTAAVRRGTDEDAAGDDDDPFGACAAGDVPEGFASSAAFNNLSFSSSSSSSTSDLPDPYGSCHDWDDSAASVE